jgi:large subunit ribosomal protein L35
MLIAEPIAFYPQMERLHQMHVIPDILPDFHPSFDVRVSFPKAPSSRGPQRTRRYEPVEPGVFLSSLQVSGFCTQICGGKAVLTYELVQTWRPPKLYTSVFHPETRYYTLVLVDAGELPEQLHLTSSLVLIVLCCVDVPDPESQSYTTYLHWMQYVCLCSPHPVIPLTNQNPSHSLHKTQNQRPPLLHVPLPNPPFLHPHPLHPSTPPTRHTLPPLLPLHPA